VAISYVPLGKLNIERQQKVFRLLGMRNKLGPAKAGPNLLILANLAISPLFGGI
jgi:hypothetical protein